MGVSITGTGISLPAEVLTSAALEQLLELEPGWIERRTGIRERRIAAQDQAVSDLALVAAGAALRAAHIDRSRLALLVLATSTPDHPLPPTAPAVASSLGLRIPAFDIAAACTGFLYGLAVAQRWLLAGTTSDDGDAALVIGANVLSRRVNWVDRMTAPIFGDGAGAVVLERSAADQTGVLALHLDSDGSYWRDIYIPAGGSRQPVQHTAIEAGDVFMRMENGERLFRRVVRALESSARRALGLARLDVSAVDWYVPHQGGARIVARSAELLGVPASKVVSNLGRYGNTSAASIPIALHEAAHDGRLRQGDLVLLAAAGSGLTSGAAVVRWDMALPVGPTSSNSDTGACT